MVYVCFCGVIMYNMLKCPKCKCENIVQGNLSGPVTLGINGLLDWLDDFKTFTCKDCGYTELVKIEKVKEQFVAR